MRAGGGDIPTPYRGGISIGPDGQEVVPPGVQLPKSVPFQTAPW